MYKALFNIKKTSLLLCKCIVSVGLTLLIFSTASAESSEVNKKSQRKLANKLMCATLNQEFQYNEDYTLDDIRALRNSIFAQYGFKFTNAEVAAEMNLRGCQKTDVVYNYKLLTDIDKKNVKQLKAIEADLIESAPMDFNKEWEKEKNLTKKSNLLKNYYCQLYNSENQYKGVLFFNKNRVQGGFKLSAMLDPNKATWIGVGEGNSDSTSIQKIDSTSLKGLDSTSIAGVIMKITGRWVVTEDGKVTATMKGLGRTSDTTVIEISMKNKDLNVLNCVVSK